MARNFNRLVVDAHPVMYRMAYRLGQKGKPAWGLPCIGGFLDFLREFSFQKQPQAIYLVWESGTMSARRRAVFPEYKKGRSDDRDRDVNEEGIRQATSVLVPLVRRLACHVFSVPGKEGDDVLARIVLNVGDCVVLSDDHDFYQLLPYGAYVYQPIKRRLVSEHQFADVGPVDARQYVLWKSLVGDPSDGIPGVKGVGKKTASDLLHQFPRVLTVSALREAISEMTKPGKRVLRITKNWPLVERNVELMDLTREPFSEVEDLAIRKNLERRPAFDPAVRGMLQELGLIRFAADFDEWSIPFQQLGIGGDHG